jgi:pimeloyl-ACP methyl ester carboxylesterase
MQRLTSPAGTTVSYDRYGSGPPLVLVHGSFSDHRTNCAFVKPLFERLFTVHAIARRGPGETAATEGHSLEDESADVVAVTRAIGEPAFLLGHSGFKAERFRELRVPVLLQVGTESPRDLYVTDDLAAVVPDVRIEELPGQAHEGMTTAPGMHAAAVSRFLLA